MNEEDDLEAKEDDAGEAHEESKLGKLFDKAKGKAAEGLEAAKSGVRKGASAGKALAQRGAKATKGFVESGAVKAKVEKTKAVTKKLAKATGEGTKLAAGKVKEASAKAFEKTAEGASAAAKATKHFAGKVAEKTVEGGTTAFEKVRETAESVGEFTKEKLEGAKEALGGRKAGFAEPQSSEPQSSGSGARNSVAGEPEFLGRLGEARQSAKAQREAPEPKEGKARTEAQTAWEPNQKAGGAGTAKNGRAEPQKAEARKAEGEAQEPSWSGTVEGGTTAFEKVKETADSFGEFTKEKLEGAREALGGRKAGPAEPQKAEAQQEARKAEGKARSAKEPEFLGRLGEARQSAKAQKREAPEPQEGKARTEAPTDLEPNQKAGGAGTAKNGRAEPRETQAQNSESGPRGNSWSGTEEATLRVKRRPLAEDFSFLKAGLAEPQEAEPQNSESGARSAGEPEFLGRLGEARRTAKAQREAPEPREGDARTDLDPNQKAGGAGTAKNGRAEAQKAEAEPKEAEPQSSEGGARSAGEPEFLGRLGEARQSAKAQREAPEPKEGKARTEAQTAWEPNQKAGEAGTAKNGRAEAQKAEAEPKEAGRAETMAEELDQTAGAYAAKTKGKKFLLAVACAGALAGGGLTYSVVGPRYTIAEEFALTYDCIFNQKQKISARNYEKLAECCAEVVEKLEEKFPSLKSIADKETEVASQIQESCRND